MTAARYALYFAPAADSAFWRFGCAWLGRDPESGDRPASPALTGDAARDWPPDALAALKTSPANYGFHATLKPPFRLADGRSRAELEAAAAAYAARRSPFVCPDVRVQALGRFIAFRLAVDAPEMTALAAAAVEAIDEFRGPQTEAELAKRRASGLTDNQERMLAAWGYPYVMDEFRFHMTLTGSIADDAKRDRLAAALHGMAEAAGAAGPMRVDGVALYEQGCAGRAVHLIPPAAIRHLRPPPGLQPSPGRRPRCRRHCAR